MEDEDDFATALQVLGRFLDRAPLTATISQIEGALEGSDQDEALRVMSEFDVELQLVRDAITVRDRLGRINDVIHATAIMVTLPAILEPGETLVKRPSLAAGNDPSRPFDLETDRRIAEFKLAQWKGKDATRKRQTFKDLVHLAADQSGRKAQLFVLGEKPGRFLRTTIAKAEWGLDRSPATQTLFAEQFGSLEMSIAEFTNGPGSAVGVIDLEELLPQVFSAGESE